MTQQGHVAATPSATSELRRQRPFLGYDPLCFGGRDILGDRTEGCPQSDCAGLTRVQHARIVRLFRNVPLSEIMRTHVHRAVSKRGEALGFDVNCAILILQNALRH